MIMLIFFIALFSIWIMTFIFKFSIKKTVIICNLMYIIMPIAIVGFMMFKPYSYYDKDCNDFPEVVDRAPLIRLDEDKHDKYVLVVKYTDKPEYFYIDDYELLKSNRKSFIITNNKGIYFTTPDLVGYVELYKNGEVIDGEIFDHDSKVDYGTLENNFIEASHDEISDIINKK